MAAQPSNHNNEKGFSIIDLLFAMVITLGMMAAAATLLSSSFSVRGRENRRSKALADAQRGLNMMSRDIANAGFGLKRNGIINQDSDASSIRIRANLNAFSGVPSSATLADQDEDVLYFLHVLTPGTTHGSIMRYDLNTQQSQVIVSEVDGLEIYYFDRKVDYTVDPSGVIVVTTPGVAEVDDQSLTNYIVLTLLVSLPANGQPNSPGYQPPSQVTLSSDISLRNRNLAMF
jgi:Tfp pilus assembly protein PilW